jgi:hypothetical protein
MKYVALYRSFGLLGHRRLVASLPLKIISKVP